MPIKRVNTATLIRGEFFSHRPFVPKGMQPKEPIRFRYGEPVVITDQAVLKELEDMYDETTDGDGEIFEKPRFQIARNVMPPEADSGVRRPKRLAAGRKVVKRRRIGA